MLLLMKACAAFCRKKIKRSLMASIHLSPKAVRNSRTPNRFFLSLPVLLNGMEITRLHPPASEAIFCLDHTVKDMLRASRLFYRRPRAEAHGINFNYLAETNQINIPFLRAKEQRRMGMPCYSSDKLNELVMEAKKYTAQGKVADYIPALKKENPNDLSIAIFHSDGKCISAGEVEKKITLQSISKVLTLALALMDCGEKRVFEKVGYEPTGDPFNSIVKLELYNPSKPLNPMINAGALAVTSMIKGSSINDRLERIRAFVQRLAGGQQLSYSEEVARSEFETAYLNRALCYFMMEHKIIEENVEELLELYTKQCAIEMNCLDLARIGLVFALNGEDPFTKEQLIPKDIVRICKTFMVTCGMYNAAGEFAVRIGIPAKSGVSGGIMGVVPNRFGIGIFGPALDEKGNSIAGLKLLEMLSEQYSLSIF